MGAAVEPKDFGFPQEENVPLRRPNRTRPLTNEELKVIAAQNSPPPEWFEGEEPERKFAPKPHWFLRFYRMLRKLVRQRQESQAMRDKSAWATRVVDYERSQVAAIRKASAALDAESRNKALKDIADFTKRLAAKDAELSELRQQMERRVGTLEEMLRSREKDIKSCVDLQIPQLQNELKVAKMHIQHLELLHANKVALIETLTSLLSKKMIDAESSMADSTAAMREFLSGQMGVSRQGG